MKYKSDYVFFFLATLLNLGIFGSLTFLVMSFVNKFVQFHPAAIVIFAVYMFTALTVQMWRLTKSLSVEKYIKDLGY